MWGGNLYFNTTTKAFSYNSLKRSLSLWIKVMKDGLSNDYERKSKFTALSFLSIGIISLIYTLFSSINESTVAGTTLLVAGLFSLYYTLNYSPYIKAGWLKSFLFLVGGLAVFIIPQDLLTTSAISLFTLLSLNSLLFAYLTRQDLTALSWGLDAVLSALFALYLLNDTQIHSISFIGLFIAIHLISSALVLLYSGRKIYIRP